MRRFAGCSHSVILGFSLLLSPAIVLARGPYHVKLLHPLPQPAAQNHPPATTRPAAQIEGNPISDTLRPIYQRTQERFAKGLFYKPHYQATPEEDRQFAVLLIQEVPEDLNEVPDHLHIGAVEIDSSGRMTVDTSRPTVYTARSHIVLGNTVCEQRIHLWAYPHQKGKDIVWRGVRTTYGPTGYPLIWEMLNTEGEPAVLFVCSTIEKAAEREFGRPLPGRKASVEQSLKDQPDVAVARILPPGAQPAGPVIYLDAPDKTPTTALCRCMPSQIHDFVENNYYELLPLDILGEVRIAEDGPFRLVKSSASEQSADSDQPWLVRVLRMPERF